ncbi:diphosphomevalonate decarboxylase [Fistulifera solaris]|uniref:Diphosphomevalonate decarboxylase n=1 Tax=Fistulifera solaris TaxID=1519565 RepID=A0A1Z5KG56_FISSO|nr:diphosphomevalonate decarboxylase [Fistulifera solaris]|eukprot:GAX25082.1 diphosphomevalonate decarboxylase [Fistulifera solaris]
MTTATNSIYMVTMSAPTNIAVIKYWGKADTHYNTPINSSLSVTLDQTELRAITTIAVSKQFTKDRFWLNGVEEDELLHSPRFRACIEGVQKLAQDHYDAQGNLIYSKEDWKHLHLHISSYNTFPTAAGLASSAAGYAALVAALCQLYHAVETFPGEFSTIARQGSGSACRSMYGGIVAWRQGTPKQEWRDSKAEPVLEDWPQLRALLLVVSDSKKDTSSTTGMQTSVQTSMLLQYRAQHIVPARLQAMEQACHARDFGTFAQLTMQDSNQFHATCLDTYPPIFYMNDISRQIVRIVTVYNSWAGELRAAYTFDAGPNAVIYCLEQHQQHLAALLCHYFPIPKGALSGLDTSSMALEESLLQACNETGRIPRMGDVQTMYATKPGPGPLVVTDVCNLDPETGLNCYVPSLK